MYQRMNGLTEWLDAAGKVAGSVSDAVKRVKGKPTSDELLPEITVTGRPTGISPWVIGGAIGVAALLLLRK